MLAFIRGEKSYWPLAFVWLGAKWRYMKRGSQDGGVWDFFSMIGSKKIGMEEHVKEHVPKLDGLRGKSKLKICNFLMTFLSCQKSTPATSPAIVFSYYMNSWVPTPGKGFRTLIALLYSPSCHVLLGFFSQSGFAFLRRSIGLTASAYNLEPLPINLPSSSEVLLYFMRNQKRDKTGKNSRKGWH